MTDTLLTLERYFDVLTEDAELLARSLQSDRFEAAVLACPEWTLADLGYHVGDVVRFWSWVVRSGSTTTDGEPEFARPRDRELADWLRIGVRELVDELRAADPAKPAYSWTPQRDVAFVQRRVPHELSVHRWDAQRAVDALHAPAPIAADLATDGVSEFFLLASSWPVVDAVRDGVRLCLRSTDTNQTWLTWIEGSVIQWQLLDDAASDPAVSDAVVTLSGSASDLLLTLWRRCELDGGAVAVHGDRDLAGRYLSLANLD